MKLKCGLIFLCLSTFLFVLTSCEKKENVSVAALPEEIKISFFYDNSCASCDEAGDFYKIVEKELNDVKSQYPYSIQDINVFETAGKEAFDKLLKTNGISTENLSFPLMIVGSKVYSGFETIEKNIKEAFLTAGEDIFVNQYVYNSNYPEADLASNRFPVNKEHLTAVYFYRTVCEECKQTAPTIESIPETVSQNGKNVPVDIIKINTRSGNNGELIRAFFEKYGVTEDDQAVPIVFLADGYLSGYDAISSEFLKQLEEGNGTNFTFPEQ